MGQVFLSGVFLGATYGLLAAGLSLAFGVMGVLNLAHGSLVVFGAIIYRWALLKYPVSPWVFSLAASPFFFLLGPLSYLILVSPLKRLSPSRMVVASILVSLGMALILEDFFVLWQGFEPVVNPYTLSKWTILGLTVPVLKPFLLVMNILFLLTLSLYLAKTDQGRAMRALAQDVEAALMLGVNRRKTSVMALGFASVLAGVSGVFYSTLYPLGPNEGLGLTLKALFIVVSGGLGSLLGPVISGFALGIAEAFSNALFSHALTDTLIYSLLVGYLFIRRGR